MGLKEESQGVGSNEDGRTVPELQEKFIREICREKDNFRIHRSTKEIERIVDRFCKVQGIFCSRAKVGKNKENAKKKKYHQKLGTGGYKSVVPKWEAMEADLRARGITLGTYGWPERSKHWWYGHGGTLNPETGAHFFEKKF